MKDRFGNVEPVDDNIWLVGTRMWPRRRQLNHRRKSKAPHHRKRSLTAASLETVAVRIITSVKCSEKVDRMKCANMLAIYRF